MGRRWLNRLGIQPDDPGLRAPCDQRQPGQRRSRQVPGHRAHELAPRPAPRFRLTMSSFSQLQLTRRGFLRAAATAGIGATALALVGCGDDDDAQPELAATDLQQDQQQQAQPAAQPQQQQAAEQIAQQTDQQEQQAAAQQSAQQQQQQQAMVAETTGGTLRFSALGSVGGAIDPRNIFSMIAYHSMSAAFDFLAMHGENGIVPGVAESMTPNEDATKWTIRLRPGVQFHDGRPLTAQDVAFSIAFMGDWETSPRHAAQWADVDYANMAAIDDLTLELPMLRPRADFVDASLALYAPVVPEGNEDWTLPNGSGPFRVAANDLADGVELIRNDDWWREPASLDRVVTVPITDPQARINALKSGELDFVYQIPPAVALTEQDNPEIVIKRSTIGSAAMCFTMNITLEPFNDPRVREAMRLAIDRQAMVNGVLLGQGEIGNDLVGLGTTGYHDGLPQRTRDVARAAELFSAAGVSEIDLVASEVGPGLVASAELLATQLAEAGVTVTIEELPADSFFNDVAARLSTPLQTVYYINHPPAVHQPRYVGSGAVVNLTAYTAADFDEALAASQSAVDDDERAEHLLRAQELEWNDSGMLVWGYSPLIMAHSPKVTNVRLAGEGLVQFQDIMLSS
ncbi:MAG: ABC transporter substrate-binding protein [Chloroflexi bacterium]|nr:ABC transporter substrate-binding protein [Chloroflexota bacterium]MYF23348.1 ABC transporter substrate-binding protein [Chloroflexota bacterium]